MSWRDAPRRRPYLEAMKRVEADYNVPLLAAADVRRPEELRIADRLHPPVVQA